MDFKYPSTVLNNTVYSQDAGTYWTSTQQYSTSANASSTALAITGTPTSTKRIVLDDLLISTDTAMSATIRTTGGTTFAKLYLYASAPIQLTFRNGLKSPTADLAVEILTSVSGNITVTSSYHSG
jgi:hypothetical protein